MKEPSAKADARIAAHMRGSEAAVRRERKRGQRSPTTRGSYSQEPRPESLVEQELLRFAVHLRNGNARQLVETARAIAATFDNYEADDD